MKREEATGLKVPEELFVQTTKCRHGFSCLTTRCCGSRRVCPVLASNGNGEMYLKTREDFACPYGVRRGSQRVCTCPMYYAVNRFLRA